MILFRKMIREEKDILKVEDPRDSFIIMLLERIGCLEDRLNKVIEPKLDLLNQERLNFECEGCTISKTVTKTFIIKLYHNNQDINAVMSLCENAVRDIQDRLGHKSILSISAIIEQDAFEPDYALIYMNMRRRCWVHETIKAISEVKIPCVIKVEKHICYAFNAYVGIDELSKGFIYSAYDLDGNQLSNPLWKEWTMSASILN
jgi:hypothetical protein